jgi:hypothetical protein
MISALVLLVLVLVLLILIGHDDSRPTAVQRHHIGSVGLKKKSALF